MASTLTIPPLGHTAAFVKQFPGFESIPYPFRGVLRISTTSSSGIAVIGLRVEYNALGDFLIATSMPVNEAAAPSPAAALFPHFVEGGGYTTEFVLFSGSAGQTSSGTLRFFTAVGRADELTGNRATCWMEQHSPPFHFPRRGGCAIKEWFRSLVAQTGRLVNSNKNKVRFAVRY